MTVGSKVDLGEFKAGTQLGFYLSADGYNIGTGADTYYTNDALNADGISHVKVAAAAVA